MNNQIITIDVLVIGGGGAAARAAIEAADEGVNVMMVVKGKFPYSGATAYKVSEMAGFNVGDGAADPTDSPQGHYEDIIFAGEGMAVPKLARIVADRAPDTLSRLVKWGVPYEKDSKGYLAFKSCFSRKARTHVIKGHGEPIMAALARQIQMRDIRILENTMAAQLITRENECCGAILVESSGEICIVYAKAVIIATGGAGQVFANNLNPVDVTGDGYALGYEAGAKLINMEFMQSGIGICYPKVSMINAYLWSGMPRLTNREGKDFLSFGIPEGMSVEHVMESHANHFPFSCSDDSYFIETLVQKELLEGRGSDHGGIYMDMTHMTDEYVAAVQETSGLKKMWPIAREYYESIGIHVLQKPVEITCYAHAINGGLLIDEQACTTISGLFAAGETAGGPHGANRLGGNMMLTCQIYGEIAGKSAANRAKSMSAYIEITKKDLDSRVKTIENRLYKKTNYRALLSGLQNKAQRYLLVRRDEEGLNMVIECADHITSEIYAAPGNEVSNIHNLELLNLCTAAKLMAVAAKERRESRGAHYRADYPQKNGDIYGRPQVICKGSDGIKIRCLEEA